MPEYEELPGERKDGEPTEYVPVAYGRDNEQAWQLKEILIDHDIPAVIEQEDEGEHASGSEAPAHI